MHGLVSKQFLLQTFGICRRPFELTLLPSYSLENAHEILPDMEHVERLQKSVISSFAKPSLQTFSLTSPC